MVLMLLLMHTGAHPAHRDSSGLEPHGKTKNAFLTQTQSLRTPLSALCEKTPWPIGALVLRSVIHSITAQPHGTSAIHRNLH